ncbi:MAG: hypothetical protein ABI239_05080 [Aquihabitans sp.]
MKMRAIALCAAALFLPLAAACSASDDGKKDGSDENITVGGSTVTELSEQLQQGGIPKQQADCLAQAYGELDLNEPDLKRLQEGDTSVLKGSDMTSYARTAAECMTTSDTIGVGPTP